MPGSLCNSPSLMSGATPMLSRLSALMCRQKGLVLLLSNEALRMLLMCAFFLSARGQDYKEKHKTRLKTNVKRTVLNNTKLRHF